MCAVDIVSFSTSLSIINKLSELKQNVSGMTGHKPAEVCCIFY